MDDANIAVQTGFRAVEDSRSPASSRDESAKVPQQTVAAYQTQSTLPLPADAVVVSLASIGNSKSSSSASDKVENAAGAAKEEDLKAKTDELEEIFSQIASPFKVNFTPSSKGLRFQIIDANSGEVLREYPSSQLSNIASGLQSKQPGTLLDQAA